MTIITKASLGAELGVTKARVSQYVKRGMPVRSDGKIDREKAVKWIAENYANYGHTRTPGVKRASHLAEELKARPASSPRRPAPDGSSGQVGHSNPEGDPVGAAIVMTAAEMVVRAGSIVSQAAIRLGLPIQTAYALNWMMEMKLSSDADDFLVRCGLTRFRDWTVLEIVPPHDRPEDWAALAAEAGEPVDIEAWDTFVATLESDWPSQAGTRSMRIGP